MNAFEKVLFEALMDVMDKVWHDTESEAHPPPTPATTAKPGIA